MQVNKTKAKLANDETVYGWIVAANVPSIIDLAAGTGLDFVFLDCEHGSAAIEDLEDMGRAADIAGVTPIVRVPANRPEIILRTLDRGMGGIVVPHISTKAEAEQAVRSARYAPEGDRSAGGGRVMQGIYETDTYGFVNRETLVCGMIEDDEGFRNLDEILTVPGLDVIHIGPGDISMSMGHPGDQRHPDVQARIDEIIRRTRAAGKHVGLGANRVSDVAAFKAAEAKGVRFFTLALVQLITNSTRGFLEQVRSQ